MATDTTTRSPGAPHHEGPRRFAAAPDEGSRVVLRRPWSAIVTALDKAIAPFWERWPLFLCLVAVAVWASVWGFDSFYGPQYGRVPWYAVPFVPDSPLSTASWIVAAFALKWGWDRRGATGTAWTFFANWAAMMNAKVGVWTAFVILYFYDHFIGDGSAPNVAFQWMLIVAHLGMVAFAVMLWRKMRALSATGYLLILALGLLWDFMDYFFVGIFLPGSGITIFPNGVPTDPGPIRSVAAVTVGLTLASTGLLALGMRLRGPVVAR